MRNLFLLFALTMITSSCNQGKLSELSRSDIMVIATRFASEKIDSAIVVTDNNGIVSIGDELVRFVIDPANIYTGELDEYRGKDIMVSIDSLHDPYLMPAWHLILNGDNDELTIKAAIRSDIRVLSVDKGIITAEIPTHDPSSPLYYCSECRDTVDYRIAGGRFEAVIGDR